MTLSTLFGEIFFMKKKTIRYTMQMRVDKELSDTLAKIAKEKGLRKTHLVRMIIVERLKKDGYL